MKIQSCKIDFKRFYSKLNIKIQKICFINGVSWRIKGGEVSHETERFLYVKDISLQFGRDNLNGVKRFKSTRIK